MDTLLLKYYFWLTILVVVILVGIVAWLLGLDTLDHITKDLSRCKSIIEMYGGNYLSHLIYSGDKDVFMHEAQQAF